MSSLQYTIVKSFLNNGVMREKSREINLESRSRGLMRNESVISVDGEPFSEPFVCFYDKKSKQGFYRQGSNIALAPEEEITKMGADLQNIRDLRPSERFEICRLGSVKYEGDDVEIFARYSWTKDPGVWSTVWINIQSGMILKTVEYHKLGMLSLSEVRDIKIDEEIPDQIFRKGFESVDGLPTLSLDAFLDM